MANTTARLGLPVIAPSQAQKHVTHNEALARLDAFTQLVIEARGAETPPAVPGEGQVFALGPAPQGVWAGQGGMLAQWVEPAWLFFAPAEGWRAWDRQAGAFCAFRDSAWQEVIPDLQDLDGVGIGAGWDAVNRLSVAAEATLLSHDGAGHQLKINKAGPGDTASLLYQSGWTGHAEIGLSGDNDFHLKVSTDGSAWTEALVVAAASGRVSGAAVQADATDTAAGKLARADFTYGPGNLLGPVSEAGGIPTGAVIERGSNANGDYVRFADGTQICTNLVTLLTFSGNSYFINTSASFAATFAAPPSVHLTLDQADFEVSCESVGGPSRMELSNLGLSNLSTTNCTPRLWCQAGAANRFNTSTTALCHVTAIGRWF